MKMPSSFNSHYLSLRNVRPAIPLRYILVILGRVRRYAACKNDGLLLGKSVIFFMVEAMGIKILVENDKKTWFQQNFRVSY